MIDDKNKECLNERKIIMESGWVEGEINQYITNMKCLMKTEILRFWNVFEILKDFYCFSIGKEVPQKQELNFEEYEKDLGEMELIETNEENKEIFPKIEFLHETAI